MSGGWWRRCGKRASDGFVLPRRDGLRQSGGWVRFFEIGVELLRFVAHGCAVFVLKARE